MGNVKVGDEVTREYALRAAKAIYLELPAPVADDVSRVIHALLARADLASAEAAVVVVVAIEILEDALTENKTEHGVWFTNATDEALDKLYYLRSNPTSAAQAWIKARDEAKADCIRLNNEKTDAIERAIVAERLLAEVRKNDPS